MRFLLDTHMLWWLTENSSLPASARKLIANKNHDVLVSAASVWEIATKVRLGKLPIAIDLAHDFTAYLERERFETLAVGADHGIRAGLLPGPHKAEICCRASAQATGFTLPESNSCMRRAISFCHSASAPSSTVSSRLSSSEPAKAARAAGGSASAFFSSSEISSFIAAFHLRMAQIEEQDE
jgi:PIN domain nuclease of toxin-antitoxin system